MNELIITFLLYIIMYPIGTFTINHTKHEPIKQTKLVGNINGLGWMNELNYYPPPRFRNESDKKYYTRTYEHRLNALKNIFDTDPNVMITAEDSFFKSSVRLRIDLFLNKLLAK